MDTVWSFGSLELDQFVERKDFLAINFLKQESWKQRAETGESENFAFGMPMELKYRSAEMGLDLCQIQPYTST